MGRLRSVLQTYRTWYHRLNETQQKLFVHRVKKFVKGKRFLGRSVKVTDELKVLVSSAAVQISLGLKKYMLPHFKTIILYPDSYFSHISGRYHQGEVHLGGAIVLSVDDFMKGMQDPGDGFNTGIHEFAHALYFENFIQNEDYLFIDRKEFAEWHGEAGAYMAKVASGAADFIRTYAADNVQEFFAVSTEHFFEQPMAFSEHLPHLYARMCKLFNQDPAATLALHRA